MVLDDENLSLTQIYVKLKEVIEKETASIKEELINTNKQLVKSLEEANIKIQDLEKENKQLHKLIEENTQNARKNDLIIFGLEHEAGEDIYSKTINFFNTSLKIKVSKNDINHIYKFGKTGTVKPIVIKFVCIHKKNEVLKQGNLLKNTPYAISNNLSKKEREIQRELRSCLKEIKSKKPEAKIRNNKIVIGESSFNLDEIKIKIQQKVYCDTDKEDHGKHTRINECVGTSGHKDKAPANYTRSRVKTGNPSTHPKSDI